MAAQRPGPLHRVSGLPAAKDPATNSSTLPNLSRKPRPFWFPTVLLKPSNVALEMGRELCY